MIDLIAELFEGIFFDDPVTIIVTIIFLIGMCAFAFAMIYALAGGLDVLTTWL